MLMIKLARRGKKHQPLFRLIVQEKTKDPFGDFLEDLGFWNPRAKKGDFKAERIQHWISKGAQLTDSVHNLLINQKIVQGLKRSVLHQSAKKAKKQEVKTEAAAPATPKLA